MAIAPLINAELKKEVGFILNRHFSRFSKEDRKGVI